MNEKQLLFQKIARDLTFGLAVISIVSYSQPAQAQPTAPDSNAYSEQLRFVLQPLSNQQNADFTEDGRPIGRTGGGSRDSEQTIEGKYLTALVPLIEQIPLVLGLTAAERPTFWFYIPYRSTPTTKVSFSLSDDEEEPIYEQIYQFSNLPGIVSIALPENLPPLESDRKYFWKCSVLNPQDSTIDDTVEGAIARVSLSSELMTQLKNVTSLRECILLYAARGLWYDALTALAQLRRELPQDSVIQMDWKNLLQSIDLDNLADEPIVA